MGETPVIRAESGTHVYIDRQGELYRIAEYIPPDKGDQRGMLVQQTWLSATMFNRFAERCTDLKEEDRQRLVRQIP